MKNNTITALSTLVTLSIIFVAITLYHGGSLYWDFLGGFSAPIIIISLVSFVIRQLFFSQSSLNKSILIGVTIGIVSSLIMMGYLKALSYLAI
jgi:hypothetical protein